MIPRYSRPEMAAIWSEQAKFERWLEVEIAVCEARAAAGEMPVEAAQLIRANATFDVDKVNEYLAVTHHDMTAFLQSVADSLGEESRYVHFGLTTSDVWDTATALQLKAAADLLIAGVEQLTGRWSGSLASTGTRSARGGRTASTPSPRRSG